MATYSELIEAAGHSPLIERVRVACLVAAEAIRNEAGTTPNHAARLAWARGVFASPESEQTRMLWAALVQNRLLPLAAIKAADDAAVQTAVDSAVALFAS